MAGRFWTDAELATLRALYPDMRGIDVAARLGCSMARVYNKANALGLSKSDAFKASDLSARIRRGVAPGAVRHQFPKGNEPWNKGTAWDSGGRSHETRFKAGRPACEAANYVPVGSLRVSKDGYLERKLTDDQSLYPARRWVPVHRTVWETAHGQIPAGHIVTYRPGMKTIVETEITADRLECITRAENARRNHPRSKSPELARLVQLKGAITRQVNRITREAQEQAT